MPTLNEVKEQMVVVNSVGEFTNALQQIATIRMIKLREKVLVSRPFVEAATEMLKELNALRNTLNIDELIKLENKHKHEITAPPPDHNAVIVITSNQGLTGQYNFEIYRKIEKILEQEKESDFYVIGKKGQEYFANGKLKVHSYPYEVPDNFTTDDLRRLTELFDYYSHITLVYSRYINSATRDVVVLSVVTPQLEAEDEDEEEEEKTEQTVKTAQADDSKVKKNKKKNKKKKGKFIFEPDIIELISDVSKKLRSALFQQQIMDARLSQFSAQMIGMKTASDNANNLLADLRMEYNKQRRKMIDKKISEVFAGSALW